MFSPKTLTKVMRLSVISSSRRRSNFRCAAVRWPVVRRTRRPAATHMTLCGVCDEAGNVIEMHDHPGDFKSVVSFFTRITSHFRKFHPFSLDGNGRGVERL